MSVCCDAGPLGSTVEHPGPVGAYLWRGVVIPTWSVPAFAAEAERDDLAPIHRALALSIVNEATPIYPYREER